MQKKKKSRTLYFGKRADIQYTISLIGKMVEWVAEWVYLGLALNSGKTFEYSVKDRIKKFYQCANAIFQIDGRSNDMVMLRLVETHCIPILRHGIEVIHVTNRDERRQLRATFNSVFRRIFQYRWSEIVRALQDFLGRPTWEELVDEHHSRFTFNRVILALYLLL